MGLKIYTYSDPYAIDRESYRNEIRNCAHFCVSQTMVNGLEDIYPSLNEGGYLTTMRILCNTLYSDREDENKRVKQIMEVDNAVNSLVFDGDESGNARRSLEYNTRSLVKCIRLFKELGLSPNGFDISRMNTDQKYLIDIYRSVCGKERSSFEFCRVFDPDVIDEKILKALKNKHGDYPYDKLDRSTVVIHGIHQFTPAMLCAIEDISRFKNVIGFFADFNAGGDNFNRFYRRIHDFIVKRTQDMDSLDIEMKEVIAKLLARMNKIDLPDTGTFTCLKQTMSFYLSQDDRLTHGANWIVRDFEQIDGDILRSSKQKADRTCCHFCCLSDKDMCSAKDERLPWPLDISFFEYSYEPLEHNYRIFLKSKMEFKNFKRYALLYSLEFNRIGCKIVLKPYQLKTVMRCLSGAECRYMIADEVGLGKTIEAASVLKVYLSDKKNKKVLICVPDALVEQRKTELAFKFRLFNGENPNGNNIELIPMSRITEVNGKYDFIIADEVHSILNKKIHYEAVLQLSRTADNVIMLSATPVQSRNEKYHKLLSLILPERYCGMSEKEFTDLLELQNKIVRRIYSAIGYLEDCKEAVRDSDNKHTEDTREAYDELIGALEDIADKTNDKTIEEDIKDLNYESENFSLIKLERIAAYICEAYQIEKCIIRSRKRPEDTNRRILKEIPYEMDTEFNNTQFRIYSLLSEWISENKFDKEDFDSKILPLINAFFSSSAAFSDELKKVDTVPAEITELSERWIYEDKNTIKEIKNILNDPFNYMSRMVAVCDYLDQEAYDKKVLIFTHFTGTHRQFRQLLTAVFGEESCAFFCEGMSPDELELNTYRFQNEPGCRIMLSDESGGEGRNFQKADELICLDLPWSANTLEQRIGRLDRIGRDKTKDVVSVIVYAQDSAEKDLAEIWSRGLNIFSRSQSGLEIIMNDIDEQIKAAVMNDFKYGLSSIVGDMIEEIKKTEKQVKEERHFDIAAYTYQYINKEIEKTVKRYNGNESELFRSSMLSWSSLAGFHGSSISEKTVRFNASSFSARSAYNTMFVPPDMDAMIKDRLNQMQNRIRVLNGDKTIQNDIYSIQGTFDRDTAPENDYLHFFAPGDGIFDSIVNNAISAYKGRCAAFAFESEVNREGLIFSWYVMPDELLLLKNGISLKRINQYRGFLSSEIISTYVSIDGSDTQTDPKVIKEFAKFFSIPVSQLKYYFANFGKRTPSNDFLRIKERDAVSNLSRFKETHSVSEWTSTVNACYDTAKKQAREQFRKHIRIKALNDTLNREYCSLCASDVYFGRDPGSAEKMRINEIILEAFAKPAIILDSVCYVRMIDQ